MSDDARGSGMTRAMKIAIAVVGALAAAGIITAIALTAAAGPGARPGPHPATTAAARSTSGPLPGATPTSGSEVPPPPATPLSALPPASARPAKPLISAPLPASGSKDGGIVDGFPTAIAGPAAGSTVRSSSIAAQSTVMQVTLSALSSASQNDIRAEYRTRWAAAGLNEQPTADGTMTFVGAYESLTLSFGSSGTGTLYTVFGVLRTQ
ncbi:hypothetical protein [Microbacterium capsulatum]|uniref:Lipoprotein n=1 Tax=Microbacterium capsulatum TaxID=3041921 RepID=A0ABU0XHB3_9MICO|nr:hypothetical protein [Microbacterium sp. ASV81]MDQ4214282.1 hypothetical protein [Microbacterium sp. ASV81]